MPLAQRLRKPSQPLHIVDEPGYAGTAGAVVHRLHRRGIERACRLDLGVGLEGMKLLGQGLIENRLLTRQSFGVAITEDGELAAQQRYTRIVLSDLDRLAGVVEARLRLIFEFLQTGKRLF